MATKPEEKQIFESLSEKLKTKYLFLKDLCEDDALPYIQAHATYFNSHGTRHSKAIIGNLNAMLDYFDLLDTVEPHEAYFLHCSAYLHDIGMLINRYKGEELTDDEMREIHHILSEEFIVNNYEKIGIKNKNLAKYIGIICKSHRRAVPIETVKPKELTINHEGIRLQFLSSIFRLADAMDITDDRAPELISDYVRNLPPESQKHWEVCQYIPGWGINDNNIVIHANINSDSYLNLLTWKTFDLYDELWRIQDIISTYKLPIIDITMVVSNNITQSETHISGKEIWKSVLEERIGSSLTGRAFRESFDAFS